MQMDINVDKALLKVIRTGEVIIGANRSIDAAVKGDAKMVVIASNCLESVKEQIGSTDVPIFNYPGTSVELGPACGKPFTIATMAIIDVGESNLLNIV